MKSESGERIQCIRCDAVAAVHKNSLSFSGLVEGEDVHFKGPGWKCENCDEQWATAEDLEEHDRLKAEGYRAKYGLMTAAEMEHSRKELGSSKLAFTQMLNVPRMTYDRWLKGVVQGHAMDQAVRAKLDEKTAVVNNLRHIWKKHAQKAACLRGNTEPAYEKLFALILSFVQGKGRKKLAELYLNKLCWYADQLSYNVFGHSISGSTYVALGWGPVIASYDQNFRAMILLGYLCQAGEHDYDAPDELPDISRLTSQNEKVVKFVWQHFKDSLPSLATRSHKEAGWAKTEQLDEISFDLTKKLNELNEGRFRRETE